MCVCVCGFAVPFLMAPNSDDWDPPLCDVDDVEARPVDPKANFKTDLWGRLEAGALGKGQRC